MTAISSLAPISEDKNVSLVTSKKNSVSDMGSTTDTPARERADVPVTSAGSADDSHGLSTPDCDSMEVKLTPVSRWANVQEALEACLDPFFLAGQASVKDDKIAEELLQLVDTSLTAHVPALASLSFLQPFFNGSTRSERLDAVLGAARASNKLLLRDDLPVPPASGFMLSVDEAEAAGLRVGPRSHAEGVSRSVLSLERKHAANASVDVEETLRKCTAAQLQATVPQHRIVKVERQESPCLVRAVFVTPAAADRAFAVWRAHAPLPEMRVTRVGGSTTSGSGKSLTAAPRSATATLVVPAPRTTLKCPRVVGEALSRPSSSENVADLSGKTATAAAPPPRPAVPVPKPPPAIDAGLPVGPKALAVAVAATPAASSGSSTAATTPSPENSTTKSKFNMNAAPFLPKSVLDAQMAAAAGGGWWPPQQQRGSRAVRRTPNCEEVSSAAISMDTSEALANQMLMDSSSGWMYPGLDPYNGPSWGNKFTAVDGWVEGNMGGGSDVAAGLPSTAAPARKETPAMPERPKAVGGDMPVAPCALGDSPSAKGLQPVGATSPQSRVELYAPRPMSMSLPPEQIGGGSCSAYDAVCPARTSPLSQTSPPSLSTSRRHRHDPYSPTGFVLCAESSCASSLSHPPGGNLSTTPASNNNTNKLLFAGSLTSEKMASFCFEDPLIKASARRRERRRQMQAESGQGEAGAARTSSSVEGDSSASSNLERSQSTQADSNSSAHSSKNSSTGDVAALAVAAAAPAAQAEAALVTPAPEPAQSAAAVVAESAVASPSPAPAPKSYAEALRLKAKASPSPAVVVTAATTKPTEAKKDKTGKASTTSTTRSAGVADKKSGAGASKAASAPAGKSLAKPKKTAVTA